MLQENNNNQSNEIVVNTKSNVEFIENIRKWVILDTQIRTITEKTKVIRELKQKVTTQICEYITEKNIQHKKIEISDGELKMYTKNEYSPLTFSYIEECLTKIISNKENVQYIMKYLKENREIKHSSDIRRNFSK
jgi:hypothetical protein